MSRTIVFAVLLGGCTSPQYDYETIVKAELRDPASAQFSDVAVNIESACGFVNSKNGYGGYSGRQPFVAVGEGVTMIEPGSSAAELVNARCQEPARTKINDWLAEAAIEALD